MVPTWIIQKQNKTKQMNNNNNKTKKQNKNLTDSHLP